MRSDRDSCTRNFHHTSRTRLIPLVIVEPNSDAETNSEPESHNLESDASTGRTRLGAFPNSQMEVVLPYMKARSVSLQELSSGCLEPKIFVRRHHASMVELPDSGTTMNAKDELYELQPIDSPSISCGLEYTCPNTVQWNRFGEVNTWRSSIPVEWSSLKERTESYCARRKRSVAGVPNAYYWVSTSPQPHHNRIPLIDTGHLCDADYVCKQDPPTVKIRWDFASCPSSASPGPHMLSPQSSLSPTVSMSKMAPVESFLAHSYLTGQLEPLADGLPLLLPEKDLCEAQSMVHSRSTPHMNYQLEPDNSVQNVSTSVITPLIKLCRPASMNEFHYPTQTDVVNNTAEYLCYKDPTCLPRDRRKSVPNFPVQDQEEFTDSVFYPVTCGTSERINRTTITDPCPATCAHRSHNRYRPTKRSWFSRIRAKKKLSLQDNRTWIDPSYPALTEASNYLTVPNIVPDLLSSRVPDQRTVTRVRSSRSSVKPRALSIDFGSVLARKRFSITGDSTSTCSTRSSSGQLVGLTGQLLHRLSLRRLSQQSGSEPVPSRKSSVVNITNLPDWTLDSVLGEHLWNDCPTSTDVCHLNEDCSRSGAKRKCSVCRITCHVGCIETLQLSCRPTYRQADIREYRNDDKETQTVPHHWVGRRRQESKCKACAKSIQPMFTFAAKEMVAMQCTWCKASYHNKPSCFNADLHKEACSLGTHASLIVPPNWIIKMPEKNTFKSSIRRASSMNCPSTQTIQPPRLSMSTSRPENLTTASVGSRQTVTNTNGSTEASVPAAEASVDGDGARLSLIHTGDLQRISPSLRASNLLLAPQLPFVIKSNPLDVDKLKPLLVFLNPRSGGNQGLLLLRKFQWLLNPRQVFDLTQGGPRMGLELFNRVPNLRVLACGGDGTVGWVFSTIDELKLNPTPPVAVLPLGTGNDLARTLRWGAGYTDEPISKILRSIEQGTVVALDRWQVDCTLRTDTSNVNVVDEDENGRHRSVSSALPLKVFNNYFSLGADAATALEFHESREANPEKFNSRLKNKIFYAGCGGKDLLLRSWRDLCDHITLECDGKDLTPLIRSIRPHVILFLNIPRYGSGTLPWGQAPTTAGFEQPRIDDGMIEVIGLSSTTLAMLQVGGHGDRICQCRRVTLTTDKVIPMQMDGEPCRLMPATLHIHCSHQALVVQKQGHQSVMSARETDRALLTSSGDQTQLLIFVIALEDYQAIPDDAITLRQAALFYGSVAVKFTADLSLVRDVIEAFNKSVQIDQPESSTKNNGLECGRPPFCLSDSWAFIDSTTAATRFFRIDQKKESSHFITDICNMEELFLIDAGLSPRIMFEGTDDHSDEMPNGNSPKDSPSKHKSNSVENPPGESPGSESVKPLLGFPQNDSSMISESTKDGCLAKPEESVDALIETNDLNPTDEATQSQSSNHDNFAKATVVQENEVGTTEPEYEQVASDARAVKPEATRQNSNVLTKSDNESGPLNATGDSPSEAPNKQDQPSTESLNNSVERVTDWLQTIGSRRNSSSSHISQRTCEIELASSASEPEEKGKGRRKTRRNRRKLADREKTLQMRLDRAFLNASRKGIVSHIETLLEAGANILAVDERGRSGLHLATKSGCEKTIRTLLKYASPEFLELREYEKKQTALHKAAVYRRRNICQLLLKAGACPTTRDAHGKRPRRLAYDADDYQLAHYLQHEELTFTIAHGRHKITV